MDMDKQQITYRVIAFSRDDARITGIDQATRDGYHVIDADVRKVRNDTIKWDVKVRHMVYR